MLECLNNQIQLRSFILRCCRLGFLLHTQSHTHTRSHGGTGTSFFYPHLASLFSSSPLLNLIVLSTDLQTEKAFLKQPKVFLWWVYVCVILDFMWIRCLVLNLNSKSSFILFFLWWIVVDRILISITHLISYLFECSSKKSGKGKAPGKGGNRYFKSIGLGFKTPREASEGAIFLFVFT